MKTLSKIAHIVSALSGVILVITIISIQKIRQYGTECVYSDSLSNNDY
ncbi:hypothetical protein KIH21_14195 [Lacticaseibacillus paracasei subsp. paracasei]|nr:hypothetical protein KIH21_14195 [Lacticaseibacillus paracasei subsp. paracasei]